MKKLRSNQRGAAMITAIITIMFIAVLGTTLLSMAYSNYIMKINNMRSKDNFYNSEIALDEVRAALQSTGSKAGVKNLLNDTNYVIKNADGSGSMVASKMFPVSNAKADDSMNGVTDSVTVTFDEIVEGANSITIKGVRATSTVDGYQTSVSTDIVMTFPTGGKYKLDINDFSILSDSAFSIASDGQAGASNANVYGYLYCTIDPTITVSGVPGNNIALCLRKSCITNILSKAAIINGDLVVTDKATLTILGGSVVVNGNVYVKDNATLVCGGNLKVKGTIQIDSNAKIIKAGTVVENASDIQIDEYLNGGKVTENLFQTIMVDGVYESGTTYKQVTIADLIHQDQEWVASLTHAMGNYQASLFTGDGSNPTKKGNGMTNTLLLSNTDIKLQSGKYENTTILTSGKLDVAVQKVYITTMMDNGVYEQLKQLKLTNVWFDGMGSSINNPQRVIPKTENGITTYEKRDLLYGDFLKSSEETSRFLSGLFNAADKTGGAEKVVIGYSNWTKNAE